MPAKLQIGISGLCLFVADRDQLHVLMPRTGAGAFGGSDQHAATLVVPKRHISGGTGGANDLFISW
jgi:hypothetical protein